MKRNLPNCTRSLIIIVVLIIFISVCVVIYLPINYGFPNAAIFRVINNKYDFSCYTFGGGCDFVNYEDDFNNRVVSSHRSIYPSLTGLYRYAFRPYIGNVFVISGSSDMAIFLKKQNRIFRDTPYSLEIVRFNIDQVRNDWNSLSFEEGTPVEWQQKGNYYIIKEPIENSVYIARSYWKDGWIEHMWLAVDRYAEIELGNQDVVEIH